MPQLFLNNFQTQFIASVKAMPDSASPALELDYGVLRVSDGAAGLLLNPIPGSWYVLTSFKRAGSAETDYEVMHVTAVDNAVIGECRLTVLRGQEGTTPKAYVAGDIIEMRLTAGGMNQHVQTTDARMVNARAPAGAAGGVLSGEYPNPGFAQAMATAADLGGKVDKVAGKFLSANDYTNAERVKLANVAEQATKNATDADLRDRASHTGIQAIATVSGLPEALGGKQPTLVSGANIKTVNGQSLLGAGNIDGGATIPLLAYDDRGQLRTSLAGGNAVVDGLGLFQYAADSTEPDDDESCFATPSGRWLLQAAHWDVVDAWQAPDDAARDAWDEDEALRFASSFASKVLTGSATCAITAVGGQSSVSFAGTVAGAAVGDRVIATPPAQLGSTAIDTAFASYHAWVSGANTVTVMLTCPVANGFTTNPAIRTEWPITVIKS